MFLYTKNAEAASFTDRRVAPFLPRRMQTLRHGAASLFWLEDGFTEIDEESRRVSVRVLRPQVDRVPILCFEWNVVSGEVYLHRRWSGEFAAYVVEKPTFMIASHLRFIAWLCDGIPPGTRIIDPGCSLQLKRDGNARLLPADNRRHKSSDSKLDYSATVKMVRGLVCQSVAEAPVSAALLLSGGVDSSVIAAAARITGKRLHAYVFGLRRPVRPQNDAENDLLNAQKVAEYFRLPIDEILLSADRLVQNVPSAIALSETHRGTIVDDCVALIEVARVLSRAGYSTVWTGEGADDLFGGFKFPLRYYRGAQLKQYYRHELNVSLPNELCVLQKIFEPQRISVVHPFWTRQLKALGENLSLAHRVDLKRLMKRVLRDAFSDILPPEICERPKGITRDTTQIRFVLESRFGKSRERYRPTFNHIFRDGFRWPAKRVNLPRNRSTR
jgi:asparagine synthetase B (glutamine-hydrolysing)